MINLEILMKICQGLVLEEICVAVQRRWLLGDELKFDKCLNCNRILENPIFQNISYTFSGRRTGCGCTDPEEYYNRSLRINL